MSACRLGADLRLRRECGLLEATLQIARCRKDGRDGLIAGMEHRGYAANVEEAVGESGSGLTGYQYEQNIYSDSQFLKDSIENAPGQEEGSILIADEAYGGYRAA